MAPASPELGIIMRLWAVSKGALMIQTRTQKGSGVKEGSKGCKAQERGNRGKSGVTEGRKGLHVGDDGQKGRWELLDRLYGTTRVRRIETGSVAISYKIPRIWPLESHRLGRGSVIHPLSFIQE